jgi:hypothetical protein
MISSSSENTASTVPDISHDAVVVIPGIMGSELIDRKTGRAVWGFDDVRWLVRAWTRRDGMAPLAMTERELDVIADDRYDPDQARVYASRLLRFPVAAPLLRGFEPYTNLLRQLTRVVAHPDAILEFPYDWRLPVELNARLLAAAIGTHLQAWRADRRQEIARRNGPDGRPAQVVLVAHSMGGLLVQGLSRIPGATNDVRTSITLGTPFYGSVDAAVILNAGRGAPLPLPHRQLRDVASTMPGVHDLLPTYRCMLNPAGGASDVVALTPADVERLGGSRYLANRSLAHHVEVHQAGLVGHRGIVGVKQKTMQSMRIIDGVVMPEYVSYVFKGGQPVRDADGGLALRDYGGDGTVYRYAGMPQGLSAETLTQQHGNLASSNGAASTVCSIVNDQGGLGIQLGVDKLGLEIPDVLQVGERGEITVTGESDPALVDCVVHYARSTEKSRDKGVAKPKLSARRDGFSGLTAAVRFDEPGLYRVSVKVDGADPVSQLVICTPPDPMISHLL